MSVAPWSPVGPVITDDPAVATVIAEVPGRVDACVRLVLEAERERWSDIDPLLGEPILTLEGFVTTGGKRLRPLFCQWGWIAAGGEPFDAVSIDAGAALEMLHAFALIHDDVMDGSVLRRNERTIHVRYIDEHVATRLRGEARRHGEGTAVLLGDLAFVYSDVLMNRALRCCVGSPASPGDGSRSDRSRSDGSAADEASALFDELRVELHVGQFLDLHSAALGVVDEERSRRVSLFKSAKYTVERPLQLGAALAGGSPELAQTLSRYGLALGEAFQLRDDVLGAFGDESVTGKPSGDDFREGKVTLLVARALDAARADRDGAALELLGRLGDPTMNADEVDAVRELIQACGALVQVERRIDELIEVAESALDGASETGVAFEGAAERGLRDMIDLTALRSC